MTEYANYHIQNNVVVITYGTQPCPHCTDRREYEGRVWWTIPRGIVLIVGGERVALCVECITKGENDE